MKFAKKLKQELHQEWCDKYLDYKLMKKVLKKNDDPSTIDIFCDVLETELLKVHGFMRGQQEAISERVGSFRDAVAPEGPSSEESNEPPREPSAPEAEVADEDRAADRGLAESHHCSQLVGDIEAFRNYASLNHAAIRKIIKKFDRRFHMQFHEAFGLPSTTALLVSGKEVGVWLLGPAHECLRLVRSVQAGGVTPSPCSHSRPARQLCFWAEELQNGAALARLRVTSPSRLDPTTVRLTAASGATGSEEGLCVRNTFIMGFRAADACAETRPRSWSSPAQFAGHASAQDEAEAKAEAEPTESHSEGEDADRGEIGQVQRQKAARPEAARPPRNQRTWPLVRASPVGSAASPATGGGSQLRWWTESNAVCPVTGFPVNLLPYPPFRFHVRGDEAAKKNRIRLADGVFIAVQVLATWNFEVCGEVLTMPDIRALDEYIKRYKLGPWRLVQALALNALSTDGATASSRATARTELEELCAQARRRADVLRKVQRQRLGNSSGAKGSR